MSSLVPFFGGASGDPHFFRQRLAWQTDPDVPATAGFIQFQSNGGPIPITPKTIPGGAITGSAKRQLPLPSILEVANSPLEMGDLDPLSAAQLRLMCNPLGQYTATNPGAGSHFRYVLGQDEATANPGQFTLHRDPNTGLIWRFLSVMSSGFSLECKGGTTLKLMSNVVVGKVDVHADGVQTAGTASTVPNLRHTLLSGGLALDSVDQDIYAKCTTAPLAGVTGFKFKRGAAATYTGPEIFVTDATWADMVGEDSLIIGTQGEQAQIYLPAAPTVVLNDVFKWSKRRGKWVLALPLRSPIPQINARFYLDGDEIKLDGGWTLKVAVPGVVRRMSGSGGRQAIGTLKTGEQQVSLDIDRLLVDYTIQQRLLQGSVMSAVIQALTDVPITGTTVYQGWGIVLPALISGSPAYDVSLGAQTRDEKLTLEAGDAASMPLTVASGQFAGTYPSDIAVICDTSIASMV